MIDRTLEIRTESSEPLFCSIISYSVDRTGKPSVGILTELTFWPDIFSLGTYRNELSERPLAGTCES